MKGPYQVRDDFYTESAVFIGCDSISGPQLTGDAWDVKEQRLFLQGSPTSQRWNSTNQSYGDESQIRLQNLMQERHSIQGQDFYLNPCKGLLPVQFRQLFQTFFFLKDFVTSPTHAKSHCLPIFYSVKLRIFGQPHKTWSSLYTLFAYINLLLTLT